MVEGVKKYLLCVLCSSVRNIITFHQLQCTVWKRYLQFPTKPRFPKRKLTSFLWKLNFSEAGKSERETWKSRNFQIFDRKSRKPSQISERKSEFTAEIWEIRENFQLWRRYGWVSNRKSGKSKRFRDGVNRFPKLRFPFGNLRRFPRKSERTENSLGFPRFPVEIQRKLPRFPEI